LLVEGRAKIQNKISKNEGSSIPGVYLMIPRLCSKQIVSSTIFPMPALPSKMRRRYANQSLKYAKTEDDAPDQDAVFFRRKITNG
jgi:hypothetical protein